MKKNYLMLVWLVCTLVCPMILGAQNYQSLSHISFVTGMSQGSSLDFKFLLKDGSDSIYIDWGNGSVIPYYVDKQNAETEYLAPSLGANIEVYGNIETLRLSHAELTSVIFHSGNTLEELEVNFNSITVANLTEAKQLKNLAISNNALTSINLDQCTELQTLSVVGNKMTALDVSHNTKLVNLYCGENMDDDTYDGILSLDVSMLPLLEELSCGGNSLTSLVLNNNPLLKRLSCSDNYSLNNLEIGVKPELLDLYSGNCGLTSLDLLGCPSLQNLVLNDNKLSTLDISTLSNLKELWISNNKFEACALDQIYAQLPTLSTGPDANNLINDYCGTSKRRSERTEAEHSKTSIAVQKNWRPTVIGDGTGCVSTIELTVAQNTPIQYKVEVSSGTLSLDNGNGTPVDITLTDNKATLNTTSEGTQVILKGNIIVLEAPNAQISAINTALDADLIRLDVSHNALTVLDLESNINLINLQASFNQLTTIFTSKMTALDTLRLASNQLVKLNLNHNSTLHFVDIEDNALTACQLDYLYAGLPVVTGTRSLKNGGTNASSTSTTTIATLKGWTLDVTGDGTGCDGSGVISFTTNKAFNSSFVMTLEAIDNSLIRLNLGNNSVLPLQLEAGVNTFTVPVCADQATLQLMGPVTSLTINDAELTQVNISGTSHLLNLDVSSNELTGALVLGTAPQLTSLNVGYNQLTSVDFSTMTALKLFRANGNTLTTIDFSALTHLEELSLTQNALSALDLTANVSLQKLVVNNATLKTIDLSHNTQLQTLFITDNQLTQLDLSHNTMLETLYVEYNPLTALDLTQNIVLSKLSIRAVPFDACTLDALYRTLPTLVPAATEDNLLNEDNYTNASTSHTDIATAKGWMIQTQGDGTGCEEVTPPAIILTFASMTEEVTIGTGGGSGTSFQIDWGNGVMDSHDAAAYVTQVPFSKTVKIYGDDIQTIRVANQGVDAIDITNAPKLGTIMCGQNNLTTLDVSHNLALVGIYCPENSMTTLDVSHNVALKVLDCHTNQISGALDCSTMSDLSSINCSDNKLTSLLLPSNDRLVGLSCSDNRLTSLDLSHLPSLDELNCYNNLLTSLDLTKNVKLTELYIYNNALTTLDVSKNVLLDDLSAGDNLLTTLDLSKNTVLTGLYLQHNQMNSLDLQYNTSLGWANLQYNNLPSINLTGLSKISLLDLSHNELATINLAAVTSLYTLKLGNNNLTDLDVSKNTSLIWLTCDSNSISTLDLSNNSRIAWLEVESNDLTTLDATAQTNLQRLFAQDNELTSIQLAGGSLEGLFLENNQLPVSELNTVINGLKDVSAVEVQENNAVWARQLHIEGNPSNGNAAIAKAESLGWIVSHDIGDGLTQTALKGFYYNSETQLVSTPSTSPYIYIYNVKGQSWKLPHNGTSSLSLLPAGVYIVRYEANGLWYSQKIVK